MLIFEIKEILLYNTRENEMTHFHIFFFYFDDKKEFNNLVDYLIDWTSYYYYFLVNLNVCVCVNRIKICFLIIVLFSFSFI